MQAVETRAMDHKRFSLVLLRDSQFAIFATDQVTLNSIAGLRMMIMNPTSMVRILTQRADYTIEIGIRTMNIRVVVEEKALTIEIEIGEIAAKTAATGSLAEIKQGAIVKIGTQGAIGIWTISQSNRL